MNLLRHQHGADLLFDIVVVIFVIFLLRYNISFDAGFFVMRDTFGIMEMKINFNEIKNVVIDQGQNFHIILNEGKEFIFRVRRNSEYEDLKNQFYSVGLFKN